MVKRKDRETPQEPEVEYPTDPDVAYNQLAIQEPPRDVDLSTEPSVSNKTLAERMADIGDLTDMQAVMVRLFPEQFNANANILMVSRVHPDVFLPWIDIMATDEFMSSDPRKPINVPGIRMKWYALASIGLDGKGRIDALELGGAARDTKLLEKKMGDF